MSASPGIVESPSVAGRRLRATLIRSGDRFSHRLELIAVVGESRTLASSVDGDPRADWPPSPPLQQAHFEPRPPGGDVALLVGMAGRSHWSLSIEPFESPATGATRAPIGETAEAQAAVEQAGLRFDAACRIDRQPDSLGHAWRMTESLGEPRVESLGATWPVDGGVLALTVEPVADQATTAELRVERGVCAVRITPVPTRFPATIRWRFTWTFTRTDGHSQAIHS